VIKGRPAFLEQIIENQRAEKVLSLTMVVRPFEDCRRFNECFAACYYSVIKELIMEPLTSLRALRICLEQRHLHWAFKYFLVCYTDYPRTAVPLRDIYCLCMSFSRTWRLQSLNELIHQIPLSHYLSPLCLANRVQAVKILLGCESSNFRGDALSINVPRRSVSSFGASEDDMRKQALQVRTAICDSRKSFIKGNGFLWATQLLGIHYSSCPLLDSSFIRDARDVESVQAGVDLLATIHVGIAWIKKEIEALTFDDKFAVINVEEDPQRVADAISKKKSIEERSKELKTILNAWGNKKTLLDIVVKICFGTGQGVLHSTLPQLHRDAKFHAQCIFTALIFVEEWVNSRH